MPTRRGPKPNKSDLIRSLPASMTAPQVVAEAAKRGVKLSTQLVYVVRGSRKAAKKPGRPSTRLPQAKRGPGRPPKTPSTGLSADEKELARLVLALGLSRVEELIGKIKKALP